MEKIKISRVVIVEGKYDKIKLDSVIDATIITTNGFGIFKSEEKTAFMKRLAAERGLIVATDSDSAGLMIRNYFNSVIPKEQLAHIYIPQVAGKEKRKATASKEGTLGVEGIAAETLRGLFMPYGNGKQPICESPVSDGEFYADGFKGGENSSKKREALAKALDLPTNLSSKALLNAINLLGGKKIYETVKDRAND